MTAAQRQQIGGWWLASKEIVQFVGNALLIGGAVLGAVLWLTGGLKPQSQIATEDLTKTVNTIQSDVKDIREAMKVYPTPYEINDQRSHFGRVDDRLNKIERDTGATDARVSGLGDRITRLESPPGTYRNPPKCPGC